MLNTDNWLLKTEAIYQYWAGYYTLMYLTLYDFVNDNELEENFETLLQDMR